MLPVLPGKFHPFFLWDGWSLLRAQGVAALQCLPSLLDTFPSGILQDIGMKTAICAFFFWDALGSKAPQGHPCPPLGASVGGGARLVRFGGGCGQWVHCTGSCCPPVGSGWRGGWNSTRMLGKAEVGLRMSLPTGWRERRTRDPAGRAGEILEQEKSCFAPSCS